VLLPSLASESVQLSANQSSACPSILLFPSECLWQGKWYHGPVGESGENLGALLRKMYLKAKIYILRST